jgi:competence protein ComEC
LSWIWKRPLFYAAFLLIFILPVSRRFFPEIFDRVSPRHVVYQIKNDDAPVLLGGVVDSEVEERPGFYGGRQVSFVLNAKKLWPAEPPGTGLSVNGRVKVVLHDPSELVAYGEVVAMKGSLVLPKTLRNPGGFDYRAYLRRQGIRACFYGVPKSPVKILTSRAGNPVTERAIRVKKSLSGLFSRDFNPRDASFLNALFFGERSGLEEDFKDLFLKTGTLHILSVSGFNIGFLVLSVFFFLKFFPLSKNWKWAATLLAVWFYCILVGWQTPVVRASLMTTLMIAGRVLGRRTDLLNSLGAAAVVILAVNPLALGDVGFQLSFLAVLGIAGVYPLFRRRTVLWPNEKETFFEKAARFADELFWISFVCLLVTLPVMVQNFYIVTPLSLLANMGVVPISFLLFFCGIIFLSTAGVASGFLGAVPWVIRGLMSVLVSGLRAIENIPGSFWIVGRLEPVFFALLIAGIVFFIWDKKISSRWVRAAALCLWCWNLFLAQGLWRDWNPAFRITVLDVGQGDAIAVDFPRGGHLLIDAGKGGDSDQGRWTVAPYFKSKGVSVLDALLISHPQEDHIGGMPAVLDELRVKNVLLGTANYPTRVFGVLKRKIREERAKVFLVHEGLRIEGFKDAKLLVLNPPSGGRDAKNINEESVVLKLSYQGFSAIFTGDIQQRALAALLKYGSDLKADFLKVPHHGARVGPEGEAFFRAVNPWVSVISVGQRNLFGHPFPGTLSVLKSMENNRVLRTDQTGAVTLDMK